MQQTFSRLVADLWCLHWPGGQQAPAPAAGLHRSAVCLSTCLRQLAFGLGADPGQTHPPGGELTTGPAAYRLLLEVACGLRSAVPGETNVFGQFRRATDQAATLLEPAVWQRLKPLIEALQADTRTLRAGYLQGVAGQSYGSLVRALLAPRRDARVLFVGTGELTRSMLPLFRTFAVGVWNHRHGSPLADVCRWFATDEAADAGDWATDIVLTTPRDPDHDQAWSARLGSRALRGLVHLGRRRSDGPLLSRNPQSQLTASFDLDDVFALASARDQYRGSQLTAAALACTALVDRRLEDGCPRAALPGLARLRA
ncbi:MAG: hypothetical protein EXR82_03385 [Gammaproteobacteria bacterium]|nr:hypothetical protein [Gammaproteobacteria bacterium]